MLQEGRELLSSDIRERDRLGGSSTVQAAVGALLRDEVIAREAERYVVVDSCLKSGWRDGHSHKNEPDASALRLRREEIAGETLQPPCRRRRW